MLVHHTLPESDGAITYSDRLHLLGLFAQDPLAGEVQAIAFIEVSQNRQVQIVSSVEVAFVGEIQFVASISVLPRSHLVRILADRAVVVIGDPRHRFRVKVNGVVVAQNNIFVGGGIGINITINLVEAVMISDIVLLSYNQELARPLTNAIADALTGEELLPLVDFPIVVR